MKAITLTFLKDKTQDCDHERGASQTSRLYCTGLFEMIVEVLTTCHTQYT